MKTSSKKWQKIRKIKGLRQFVTWYPRHVSENPGYLLLQCGITAVSISSFNDEAAHQWTLVKLNGNYYHMDPTYEEGYGGEGLVFFGMTDDMRQIYDFPIDKFNVMNIWGSSDIQANDYTFAELWSVYMIDKIVRDESGMTIYDANGGDGQDAGILIPY